METEGNLKSYTAADHINMLVKQCHNNSVWHGFYEDSPDAKHGMWHLVRLTITEKLCLIHSEVSEALEDLREIGSHSDLISPCSLPPKLKEGLPKPVGFGSELADIVIRVFDLAGWLGIDLGSEIIRKMEYNKSRPHKHGKEF